jgi:4-carboxymuconolactone decarboxylase
MKSESSMPRITLPSPDVMNADQRAVYDKIISGPRGKIQGPLRAAIHNADLADKWQALGALLRYKTSLSPRHSELAILVTGRACQSPFEWYAHCIEALHVGIEKSIISDLLAQQEPKNLSDEDQIIWSFSQELNRYKSVSDMTYKRTLERFGEKTVVELTALIGYYTMVAMTLNAHEIPLPEGIVADFPLPQHQGMAS